MTTVVRKMLDGELLWSVLARHRVLKRFRVALSFQWLLTGNRRSPGSALFPRQIARIVHRADLPDAADRVIDEHTLFRYYVPFLEPAKVEHARRLLMTSGPVESVLGAAQEDDYPDVLKFCPVCRATDVIENGEPVWRCVPQAPGVLRCHQHGCPLLLSTVNARMVLQIASFVPLTATTTGTSIQIPEGCVTDAMWLANCANMLLTHDCPAPGAGRLATFYHCRLIAQGYTDQSGRLRWAELVNAFNARFSQLLPELGCQVPDVVSCDDNWLARVVTNSNGDSPPLRHLLLIRFLGLELLPTLKAARKLKARRPCDPRHAPALKRSAWITSARVHAWRRRWLILGARLQSGSLRGNRDSLYGRLWRNDRAWLHAHAHKAWLPDNHELRGRPSSPG